MKFYSLNYFVSCKYNLNIHVPTNDDDNVASDNDKHVNVMKSTLMKIITLTIINIRK